MKQQTNEFLRNDMWRACDILRRDDNVSDIIQYTEHLAWLLFLKFLDQIEKRSIDEAVLIDKRYIPLLAGEWAWDYWTTLPANQIIQFVRGRLLPGLASLNGSSLARIVSYVFSDEHVGSQAITRYVPVCASGHNLKGVLDIINMVRFDCVSDTFTVTCFYEDLLFQMCNESRTAGELHTPRSIIQFMIEVIDPQIGETVYDPASGLCGFLATAYEYIDNHCPTQTPVDQAFLQKETFWGQDKSALPVLLGMLKLLIRGLNANNISRINTLDEDVTASVEQSYDVIITHPPFGSREGWYIQRNLPIQTSYAELLFIQHIISKLKKTSNARAAVIVPEGVLFRGDAFAKVKKELLEQFHLFAVISLPLGVFVSYPDVKATLLFFQRPDHVLACNPSARQETWYYKMLLPEGLKKFSKGCPIQDHHFDEARTQWRQWYAYLQGKDERPFAYATDLRRQWQDYWEQGKEHTSSQPNGPTTTWVETLEDLKARGYDLSAHNPNHDDCLPLLHPTEIAATLLEQTRELQSVLLNLHEMISESKYEHN